MTDIGKLILENFTTLSLVIGLGIVTMINKTLDDRTNKSFLVFIIIVLILCVSDIIDYYLSSFSTPQGIRYFTSAIGYTLRPAAIAIIINVILRKKKSVY